MAVAAAHAGVIDSHDHIHPEPQSFLGKYVFSIDAKIIGVQYMVAGLLFFLISGLLAEVIRAQLLVPNGAIISNDTYNGVYSLHGSGMVWMVIIPLVTGGFGNYVMPLMIGARDVAFPLAQSRCVLDVSGRRRHSVQLVSRGRARCRLDRISADLAYRGRLERTCGASRSS